MAYGDALIMDSDRQILQERLSRFVRPYPAKVLARKVGCTERTAQHFRMGTAWPNARHWFNIWVEFGEDALEAVFMPERVEQRLKREAEAREQARRARIASALVEESPFGLGAGLGEGDGADEGPLEPGPPNLDLFEHFKPARDVGQSARASG